MRRAGLLAATVKLIAESPRSRGEETRTEGIEESQMNGQTINTVKCSKKPPKFSVFKIVLLLLQSVQISPPSVKAIDTVKYMYMCKLTRQGLLIFAT